MADQMIHVNSRGTAGGWSPITRAGRVAINGYSDREANAMRAHNINDQTNLYPGPFDNISQSILEGGIVWNDRLFARERHGGTNRSVDPYVSETLNGAFEKGLTSRQVQERIQVIGIANGQGSEVGDSMHGRNAYPSMAIQVGGMITIRNSGKKAIPSNSFVIWVAPDPTAPAQDLYNGTKGQQRILLKTEPYNPSEDTIKTSNVADALHEAEYSNNDLFKSSGSIHSVIMEGSQLFFEGMLDAFLIGLRVVSPEMSDEVLLNIAKGMGVGGNGTRPNKNSGGGTPSLREQLRKVWFPSAKANEKFIFSEERNSTDGKLNKPPSKPSERLVYHTQRDMIDKVIRGIKLADLDIQRRVIGITHSGALPGQDMDLHMGRGAYML